MSGTTVKSQTQRIVVVAAQQSVSVINAGPQGPNGINTALFNVDGGHANEVYSSELNIDGGSA